MKEDFVNQPVTVLKGVGSKLQEALRQIKIETVADLLFHLPLRYEDRTRITPIAELREGCKALIEGEVVSGRVQFAKRRMLVCRVCDASGEVDLRFFHFNQQQLEQLSTPGEKLRCFGEARYGFQQRVEMIHPEYRTQEYWDGLMVADCLTPIYPSSQGIRQGTWHKLIGQALDLLHSKHSELELLPKPFNSIHLIDALLYLHRPPQDAKISELLQGQHPAQQRLAFEELVAHQLGLTQFRLTWQTAKAPILLTKDHWQERLLDTLTFQLTKAQCRVIEEINLDLAKSTPMLRLVQGDVGSGKTVVAAMALLRAVENNQQAALMAPTEILAEQHYQTLSRWFAPFNIHVGYLSGRLSEKKRQEQLEKIAGGQFSIVIGTHALFQEQVKFLNLALLIIDEQHRFGVHQRLALKEKGEHGEQKPHQLIMTATPIPRTLAMTAYADLDVSIIDELPPGRTPIKTVLIPNQKRHDIIERVKANCLAGHQAYWVCTLIEDSEVLLAQAAQQTLENLLALLPELNIGLVHGRLKSPEKDAVMKEFKKGTLHLLVATTVIEVGVDVPNASLMIIENAERLGLAQLHQLRGRVGRGNQASFCVLLYQQPLSKIARERLAVMRDHQDGFCIAEKDLQIRGPGEVLGTRQTGLLRLKVADLLRDEHLLPEVQAMSRHIAAAQPNLIEPLLMRWLKGRQHYVEA